MLKEEMFNIGIIESYIAKPHLGTAYEIAITEKLAGKSVVFIFILNQDPNVTVTLNEMHQILDELRLALDSYNIPLLIFDSLKYNEAIDSFNFENIIYKLSSLSQDEVYNFEFDNVNFGKGIMSTLISFTSDLNASPKEYPELTKKLLYNSMRIHFSMKEILNLYSFDLVYSFNGRFSFLKPIFENLEKNEIQFKTHERGGTYDRYEIFDGYPHDLKLILEKVENVNENIFTKLFYSLSFFIKQRVGINTNWTSFIKEQSETNIPINDISSKIVVTYFSSSDFELEALKDLWPHNLFSNQWDAIVYLVNKFKGQSNLNFIIKMHPNQKNMPQPALQKWQNLQSENVHVFLPDSKIKSYSVVKKSDLIIVYGSTIGLEAAFLRKKVINLMNTFYTNYKKPIMEEPQTIKELEYFLNNFSKVRKYSLFNFLKVGYWIAAHGNKFKYYKPTSFFNGYFINKS